MFLELMSLTFPFHQKDHISRSHMLLQHTLHFSRAQISDVSPIHLGDDISFFQQRASLPVPDLHNPSPLPASTEGSYSKPGPRRAAGQGHGGKAAAGWPPMEVPLGMFLFIAQTGFGATADAESTGPA